LDLPHLYTVIKVFFHEYQILLPKVQSYVQIVTEIRLLKFNISEFSLNGLWIKIGNKAATMVVWLITEEHPPQP